MHESGYSVRSRGQGEVEFFDPWGSPMVNAPRPPPGDPRQLVERNLDLAIDAGTCASGDGDPMDLGLAVDALLAHLRHKDHLPA